MSESLSSLSMTEIINAPRRRSGESWQETVARRVMSRLGLKFDPDEEFKPLRRRRRGRVVYRRKGWLRLGKRRRK